MKNKILINCLLLACICQNARAFGKEDSLKNLFFKANLVVAGEATSQLELSPVHQSVDFYDFNFEAFQVLKGKALDSKKVYVEIDHSRLRYRKKLPTFHQGTKYILFLYGMPGQAKWHFAGAQLYSGDRARTLQNLRLRLVERRSLASKSVPATQSR